MVACRPNIKAEEHHRIDRVGAGALISPTTNLDALHETDESTYILEDTHQKFVVDS